jgi:molybdopterin converting factor small subunit
MSVTILIPTPLRTYVGDNASIVVAGTTIGEVLDNLASAHPSLKGHLYNEEGRLRSFVNVYLNEENIRYLQREETPVSEGDTLSIIPSIAGGSTAPTAEAK